MEVTDIAYKRPPCPACNNPLRHSVEVGEGGASEHVVYCGVGRCPSDAANDGARGKTLDEAMEKLTKAINNELQ